MNKQAIFVALLFFAVGFLVFYPTLSVGFLSDDFVWLKGSQNPQQFNLFDTQSLAFTKGRPGTMVVFLVLNKFFSVDASRFHLVMLVFHIFNAFLFFVILRNFQFPFVLSFLTALIFLIHFSNEETIFWTSCLSSIFCLFFYLITVVLYLKYIKNGSWFLKAALLGCSMLALAMREDAVSVPITLMFLNYINKRENSPSILNLLQTNFNFFLPSLAYLGWRITAAVQESMGYEFTLNPAVWVQNGLYFVLNLFVPLRFIFDQIGYEAHELLRLKIMAVKNVVFFVTVGLLLLVAISFLAVRFRNKVSRSVRAGGILGIIGFLPYFTLLGNAPRFLYFTLVGGAIIIAAGIFWLSKQISNGRHSWIVALLGFIFIGLNFTVIQERSRWWVGSTQTVTSILEQTKVLADCLAPGDTMYVVNLPRRLNGAYIFHNGFSEAISFTTPRISGRVCNLGDKKLDELKGFEGRKVINFENGKPKALTDY